MDEQADQNIDRIKKSPIHVLLAGIIIILIFLVALKIITPADKKNKTAIVPSATPSPAASPEINITVPEIKEGDWKTYKNDVLGAEFQYQESWGESGTVPLKYITRLASVEKDLEKQKIHYDNSLSIIFKENSQLRVRLFNEQYGGKNQSSLDEPSVYNESGATGDIGNLKNSGNICDYKIGYDYRSNSLKTIYSDCADGVKAVLTQNKEIFNSGDRKTLYTYRLKLLSFKKLQNGYFDNALINFNIGTTGQIEDSSLDLDGFFNRTGLKKNFEINKKIFTSFVQNFKPFVPPMPAPKVFETIEGENPDITAIRAYFFDLENGKKVDTSFMNRSGQLNYDKLLGWFSDTYSAAPYQFSERSPHQFRFFLDYQDNNEVPEKYRVEILVKDGNLAPISSEKMLSDIVAFGDMSAFAEQQNGKNYVIFSQNGIETIIDEANDLNEDAESIAGIGEFLDPKFSPSGNYLTYQVVGWEWSATKIYDTKGKILRSKTYSPAAFGFTEDEKYFFDCESNAFAGELYGRVFALPDFKSEYELPFGMDENSAGLDINCEYDKDKKVIRFNIDNGDTNKNRSVEYSVVTHKVSDK